MPSIYTATGQGGVRSNFPPDSGLLIALAKVLGVRSEYFFRPVAVSLEGVEYRNPGSNTLC